MNLTARQAEAEHVLTSDAKHILLEGGSRSGKTFLIVRQMVIRAIKAPGSRHALLRFRLNAIKSTIIADTFPKVMSLAFPEVPYQLNKSDFYATIDRSELWFGGLDDGSDRYTWDVRQEKGEYGVRVEIRPR